MSYSLTTDWRNKHNHRLGRSPQNYNPMYHSIASYCTEIKSEKMDTKSDLNELLDRSNYINHLHMLPNPLKKNLGDAYPDKTTKIPRMYPQEKREMSTNATKPKEMPPEAFNTTFGSIGSFITGVFNVISSAMPFQKRAKSPEHDMNIGCAPDGSPPLDFWLPAKFEMQNKNNCRDQLNAQSCPNTTHESGDGEMSSDCHTAAVNCEDKLNKVRMLLVSKPVPKPQAVVRPRRPKKVFVEPNTVEDGFVDAFTPEDFVRLSSDQVVECLSLCNHVTEELVQVEGAKMKTEVASLESTEFANPIDVSVKEITKDVTSDKGVEKVGLRNGLTTSKEVITPAEVVSKTTNLLTKDLATEMAPKENCVTNIVSTKITTSEMVPKISTETVLLKDTTVVTQATGDPKTVIIQSCEDKVSRLKALLQERRKNNSKINQHSSDSIQESVEESHEHICKNKPIHINKTQNKHYKNPNRLSIERRTKANMRRDIKDDMSFANEVDLESSSAENSPKSTYLTKPKCISKTKKTKLEVPINIVTESPDTDDSCYFNEISGRFRHSSTTESEDSFQIVFTDSPQLSHRTRRMSDCDSEDSFIVFEDLPDNCYTSADVFGHSESETDFSDTDESDLDMPFKLSRNLSRTISDLTDDSLYEENAVQQLRPYSDSEDEVDSSVKMAQVDDSEILVKDEVVVSNQGLLLDAAKKLARKELPPKKVRFSESPPKVRVMRVWAFAARQARMGNWQQHGLDRDRFKRKIADVDMAISWVLKPQHRNRIKFQRFMPWWHAERRRELAEKKEREAAEEKRRLEEEAKRLEEEKRRLEEERLAEEERLRVEEERKLAALEVVERERLKAEKKRQVMINRKILLQQHMKSEEQRAAEVSRRRSENERMRKEEERHRLEAKQIAEELKKKIEEEKKRIEEEIAQLSTGKVELEQATEVAVADNGNGDVKDSVRTSEKTIEIQGQVTPVVENIVVIENSNEFVDEDGVTPLENMEAAGTKQDSKKTRAEYDVTEQSGEVETFVACEDLNSGEALASVVDQTKVVHTDSVHNNIASVSNSDIMEVKASDTNKNILSDNTENFLQDYNANPVTIGGIDRAKVGCDLQEINLPDTNDVFVDCVDKVNLEDDKHIAADCKQNNDKVEQMGGDLTVFCLAVSEINDLAESSKNNNLAYEKTEENHLKINSETSKVEDNKNSNSNTKKVNKKAKNDKLKTVKPAMKKIQFTQNCFSPTNVVKSNVSKLNTLNDDKNSNLTEIISPIVINEKSSASKQH